MIISLALVTSVPLAVGQSAGTNPPFVAVPINTMTACMGQATDQAVAANPHPSVDTVMTQCNAQWIGVQQILPPDAYLQLRSQIQTAVAQRLAADGTTP